MLLVSSPRWVGTAGHDLTDLPPGEPAVEGRGFEGYPVWQAPNEISGGGLAPRGDGFEHPRSYVEVDSIEGALATATQSGGSGVMDKAPISETSWFAVLADPDGNHIGLYEGTT